LQSQQFSVVIVTENDPPDGFHEYQKRFHPPPGRAFILGGDIILPDVAAIFYPLQIGRSSRIREKDGIFRA